MRIDKKDVNAAIQGIEAGFTWSNSEDGHDYWLGVVTKLRTILQSEGIREECRAEIERLEEQIRKLKEKCC